MVLNCEKWERFASLSIPALDIFQFDVGLSYSRDEKPGWSPAMRMVPLGTTPKS